VTCSPHKFLLFFFISNNVTRQRAHDTCITRNAFRKATLGSLASDLQNNFRLRPSYLDAYADVSTCFNRSYYVQTSFNSSRLSNGGCWLSLYADNMRVQTCEARDNAIFSSRAGLRSIVRVNVTSQPMCHVEQAVGASKSFHFLHGSRSEDGSCSRAPIPLSGAGNTLKRCLHGTRLVFVKAY
jgi:hypothetical protein